MNFKFKKQPKRLKNKILNIFTRFFLSAFIVVLFFYSAPLFINFAYNNLNNKEFTNNSKNIFLWAPGRNKKKIIKNIIKDKKFSYPASYLKSKNNFLFYSN